ncbi:MAG: Asp23/Gls24 family envelope stress response protein [Firmicutes bacterium]|nr:Asp23/Gls24 family envelope stress response protein [Bacillota bacterium]
MKKELKPQAITRYTNLIASLCNSAIDATEGLIKDDGLIKYRFGAGQLKDKNISVFIDEQDQVIVDMYVNMEFGCRVPTAVCSLQEKIKKDIEENTRFKVKKINVHISNVV